MRIGLDMMGGDFAPREAVKGILQYLENNSSPAHLFLIGDESQVNPLLAEFSIPTDKVTVVHASQVIDMHEHPTKALKEKQHSSISIGFHLLASGKTDAFISAGNTGAMRRGALARRSPPLRTRAARRVAGRTPGACCARARSHVRFRPARR